MGFITKSGLAIPNGSVGYLKLSSGTLRYVASSTVTGAAVTSISFTGLDIDTDRHYILILRLMNATASNAIITCYINNDTTDTNYYSQNVNANNAVVSASRQNTGQIMYMLASDDSSGKIEIMLDPDDIPKLMCQQVRRAGANVIQDHYTVTKTTEANITRLDITSAVANSLAIGSSVYLYKVD